MFNNVKTANILNTILDDIADKTGKKINLSSISKDIGISRRKFTDMLMRTDKCLQQDPSISMINKIITYFKNEGYYLNFNDFISSDELNEESQLNTTLTKFDKFVEPMYAAGTIIETINLNEKIDSCNVLIKSLYSNEYKIAKYKKDLLNYNLFEIVTNYNIEKDKYEIIGKIIDIK